MHLYPKKRNFRLPSGQQWTQFFKVLTKKEKIIFFVSFVLVLGSFTFISLNFYFKNTIIVPSEGGTYTEGVIGQPRFINPVYANSDIDRDLVELIFSGLMKHNGNLEIVPDMAQDYPEIEEQGRVYKFFLKEDIFWQDNVQLTADDVIFTIKTIQRSDYKSPLIANWVGVEVEKINEFGIKFTLQKSYSSFLENCTLKIIPKHIWENVSSENFPLSSYNLEPIGSGIYEIKKTKPHNSETTDSLTLTQNSLYFGEKPNISKIEFLFFNNQKELIQAAIYGNIDGLSSNSFLNISELKPLFSNLNNANYTKYYFSLQRYFAIFLNSEKSEVLSQKEIRLALNYATDKERIVNEISGISHPESVDSPILPKIYGFNPPLNIYEFNPEKAKEILEEIGFKDEDQNGLREKIVKPEQDFSFKSRLQEGSQGTEVRELQKCLAKFPEVYPSGEVCGYFGSKTKQAVISFQEKYSKDILEPWGFKNGTGIVSETTRAKLNEICFDRSEKIIPLQFSLVTVDQPQLIKVAELLQKQWKEIGIDLSIEKFPISELERDFIEPRNYESLLFGEVLGSIPDPFPFWHSSQIIDPGLNLSAYENEKADKLLEEIRTSLDLEDRNKKLELFQDILIEDIPAIFLYSLDYTYVVSKSVKGIEAKKIVDPSKRFSGIQDWYIKTKRIWK
ncbi:MAG: ABC transporter substrate-binding protein [Patescibacteria group bacterium]|nr:ABC transporter substrate-binding protein [Patescibacteria group bacterium]